MRLREQLLLLTLGPLVAATMVYAALAWPATDESMRDLHQREAWRRLDLESTQLAYGVERLQAQLDVLAAEPEVTSGSFEAAVARIERLRQASIGDEGLNFLSNSGDLIFPNGAHINVRDRDYFPDVQRGVPVVSRAIISRLSNTPIVLVQRPVKDANGTVLGAVGTAMRISGLLERVARIRVDKHGFAMVVDADGHSLGSREGGPAGATAFMADTTGRLTLGGMDANEAALIAAMRQGATGRQSIRLDGKDFTAFYQPVPALHWALALVYRNDELLAARNHTKRTVGLVLVLAVLVAIAFAFALYRRIQAPVRGLLAAQAAAAAGDLTRRATTEGPKELRELAVSFNAMADRMATERQRVQSEIASRNAATAALAEQEALFREVFEAVPSAIALLGAKDHQYRRVNAAFERERGVSRDAVIGRTADELNFPRYPEQIERMNEQRRQEGEVINFRYAIRRGDGATRELLLSARSVELRGEEIVISTSIDISEQVRLEEQLRHAQKLEIVGQLAGGVAHDFNNMLAGIVGTAELMRDELPADSPLLGQLSVILEGAGRAALLTRQLLTFSRTQSTELRRLDIHLPIAAALDLVAHTFDRKIEIRREFNARRSVVLGDPMLLQNVIMNLAINARDAMPDGGTLTVATHDVELDAESIRAQRFDGAPGRYVQLDVTDTGTGISPVVRERIFEPFFTTKPVGRGTGLGLSVVYATIKELRGTINVFSQPGHGATFTLLVPGAVGDADRNRQTPTPAVMGNGLVLLVDDEAMIRNMSSRLLGSLGYTVLTAENGEEGVETFRANRDRIKVVMLDLVMPKMDGREAFHAIRSIDPSVPVVLCSGFSTEATLVELSREQGVQMLPKPYGRSELSQVLAQAVRREE